MTVVVPDLEGVWEGVPDRVPDLEGVFEGVAVVEPVFVLEGVTEMVPVRVPV